MLLLNNQCLRNFIITVQFQGPIYAHSENPAPLPPQGVIVQPEMHLPHPGRTVSQCGLLFSSITYPHIIYVGRLDVNMRISQLLPKLPPVGSSGGVVPSERLGSCLHEECVNTGSTFGHPLDNRSTLSADSSTVEVPLNGF